MNENSMSPADIAALTNGKSGFSSDNGFGWLILILIMMAAMGGGRVNNAPAPTLPPNVATQTDVQAAVNNQTVNSGIQQILLSSANNNYENAQLINGQTNTLMQQGNTNQINMIQGFNQVVNQMQQQTSQLSSKLDSVSHHMDECCCTIQQKIMQMQLDEANRKLLEAQNKININEQSQYLLGNTGRFVAWAGSGAAAASAIAS